ncbi:MAG: carboxylesterase, partial [Gammaproteobacteria bacterium]|nr:carboxylesterase [Gammaproteobacteria bacterium]
EKSDANSGIPIFLAHGSDDTVVPIELAYVTRGKLEKEGYPATWMEYQGMMHSVSEKEIFDISEWLEGTLL